MAKKEILFSHFLSLLKIEKGANQRMLAPWLRFLLNLNSSIYNFMPRQVLVDSVYGEELLSIDDYDFKEMFQNE